MSSAPAARAYDSGVLAEVGSVGVTVKKGFVVSLGKRVTPLMPVLSPCWAPQKTTCYHSPQRVVRFFVFFFQLTVSDSTFRRNRLPAWGLLTRETKLSVLRFRLLCTFPKNFPSPCCRFRFIFHQRGYLAARRPAAQNADGLGASRRGERRANERVIW